MTHGEVRAGAVRTAAGVVLTDHVAEAIDLVTFAGDDEAIIAAAAGVLARVHATATALQMVQVVESAGAALTALTTKDRLDSLRRLMAVVHTTNDLCSLPSALVLAGEGLGQSEPGARVYTDLAALVEDALRAPAEAIVVPLLRLADLPRERGFATGVPRVAYGEARGLGPMLEASKLGANFYFPLPADLHGILDTVRLSGRHGVSPDSILLIGAAPSVQSLWERAAAGWQAPIGSVQDADLALLVAEAERPSLLVIASPNPTELIRALSVHPNLAAIPRVVVGSRTPFGLLELLIPVELDDEALRSQLGALLERGRRERAGRSQYSAGVLTRGAFLIALRREISMTRRTQSHACLATVSVKAGGADPTPGVAASVSAALKENTRSTDLIGRMSMSSFGVVLTGATAGKLTGWESAVRATVATMCLPGADVALTFEVIDLAQPPHERTKPRR